MSEFEELAAQSFQIIAAVGNARSLYIEAIHAAQQGAFDRARELVEEGGQSFIGGHDAHTALVQREAQGTPTAMCLMLTHAEDQLMSAEAFGILAEEFIDVYERFSADEQRLAELEAHGAISAGVARS